HVSAFRCQDVHRAGCRSGQKAERGIGADMSDNYQYYSHTSSGWTISTDPDAAPDKRWRAVHPVYGERFFAEHDDILCFTARHMLEQIEQAIARGDLKRP